MRPQWPSQLVSLPRLLLLTRCSLYSHHLLLPRCSLYSHRLLLPRYSLCSHRLLLTWRAP